MDKKLHTKKDAEYCLWYFKKHICKDAVLIGAFAKEKIESEHDIDIYLPNMFKKGFANWMRRIKYGKKIQNAIDAEKYESTDWGGYFFHNSIFGNVDVFFDISEFDDADFYESKIAKSALEKIKLLNKAHVSG